MEDKEKLSDDALDVVSGGSVISDLAKTLEKWKELLPGCGEKSAAVTLRDLGGAGPSGLHGRGESI